MLRNEWKYLDADNMKKDYTLLIYIHNYWQWKIQILKLKTSRQYPKKQRENHGSKQETKQDTGEHNQKQTQEVPNKI